MRVLDPKELELRRDERAKKQKSKRYKLRILPVVFLMICVYAGYALLMPLPSLSIEPVAIKFPAYKPANLVWPGYGQAAIGAVNYGLLARNGAQKPLPMASVAKVVTALAVLKTRPMHKDDPAKMITISAADVANYNQNLASGQSVIKVTVGEQLTEYQALQALLLPSANNMADVLVNWAFGSSENYLAFVNPFVKTLGMTTTNIADASGFSPQTTSVATDLAKLAEIAMNHPVIAEIVNQPEADLPVAGVVYNVNRLVGQDGIVGIKTGNTDEAGGCYLFAARRKLASGREVTVVGAVMGAVNLSQAIDDSVPLITSAFKNFVSITPVSAQQKVGIISQRNGVQADLITKNSLEIVVWSSQNLVTEFKPANPGVTASAVQQVGKLIITAGENTYETPIISKSDIPKPTILTRLTRPPLPFLN